MRWRRREHVANATSSGAGSSSSSFITAADAPDGGAASKQRPMADDKRLSMPRGEHDAYPQHRGGPQRSTSRQCLPS